jgi:hypothetical protein
VRLNFGPPPPQTLAPEASRWNLQNNNAFFLATYYTDRPSRELYPVNYRRVSGWCARGGCEGGHLVLQHGNLR